MRLIDNPRKHPADQPQLVEVITPRTNMAMITPTENLLAAISLPEPFALEMVATQRARRFLVRTNSMTMREHLQTQLAVAYPQAEFHQVDCSHDPAELAPDEQVAGCTLTLRGPQYLPLRTFHDVEIDATRSAQADPVLGILATLGDLPDGWRGFTQVVLRPAPDDWCQPYLRMAVEHPLRSERAAGNVDTSLTSIFAIGGLLIAGSIGLQSYQWYASEDWIRLASLAGGLAIGTPGVVWLTSHLVRRPIYDVRLVQEKISRIAYFSQIRLTIFAPASISTKEVELHLTHIAAAYRQFNLATGNGLRPRRLNLQRRDLRQLTPLPPTRTTSVLNIRELAGLWHLPQAQADLPLLERTTARRRLPVPAAVAHGCRLGTSNLQGRIVPVALPDALLRRHLLLVAKTRRGKSSLLLHIAQYLMEHGASARDAPSLVLVDPHRDLARAALGLVPASREVDVVYLDLSTRTRPFGLNLIDTGLGWDRDKAVSNTLTIFQREFDRFWGPRMEDAFRFALLTLYEANQAICAADPQGRTRQHTILEVPAVLTDPAFRRSVLSLVSDPIVSAWWSGYFAPLDRRLQLEIVNPVQTKVQRFAGNQAARAIVGQPRSTIDPTSWLRTRSIVIVNTAKGLVGDDTAALVGGTIINLVGLLVGEQAGLDAAQRRPVTILVDEFHTRPGADYEAILSELAKYGANLVLATQSLTQLEVLDREQRRALRSIVFANLDGLFVFHTSAEDAYYLVRELGQEVDVEDLVALGEHQCYARFSVGGERLPSFSIQLDPPPSGDIITAEKRAAASAEKYGRDWRAIDQDLRSALARIELSHRTTRDQTKAGEPDAGVARDMSTTNSTRKPARQKTRNQHRSPKRPSAVPHQATLFKVAMEARDDTHSIHDEKVGTDKGEDHGS